MKTYLLLAGLLSAVALHAEQASPEGETGIMETKTYGLDRYSRLMAKSPFDFDVPPPPPDAVIPAMVDWALAGLTKATDYSVVNLVNLKTQERLRLTRYVAPPTSKANMTKSGGDVYTLESIEFEEGKPMTVKNATARVNKNGEQGSVSFDPKVLTMKPVASKMPMPNMGQPQNGQSPIPNLPGQQPGQPGQPQQGANANNNQALLQMLQQRNNAAQPGGTPPQNPAQPGQPGQPQPQPGQPLNLPAAPQTNNQPITFSNTGGGNPAQPAGAAGAAPQARRRVVLPTNEPTPPPSIPNQ